MQKTLCLKQFGNDTSSLFDISNLKKNSLYLIVACLLPIMDGTHGKNLTSNGHSCFEQGPQLLTGKIYFELESYQLDLT